MKKMKIAALAAVLCLAAGMTAQAAGSDSSLFHAENVTVNVRKADGTLVEGASVEPRITEFTGSEPVTEEQAKVALNIEDGEYEVHPYNFNVELQYQGQKVTAAEPVTLTFEPIPDATPDSKVVVYHWTENGTREQLTGIPGDGTVTVTFTSLSPVQIVVANAVNDNSGSDNAGPGNSDSGNSDSGNSGSGNSGGSSAASAPAAPVSPKTAEGYELYMAGAAAVLALAGAFVCFRKTRA